VIVMAMARRVAERKGTTALGASGVSLSCGR
jgi:hypothetical protein